MASRVAGLTLPAGLRCDECGDGGGDTGLLQIDGMITGSRHSRFIGYHCRFEYFSNVQSLFLRVMYHCLQVSRILSQNPSRTLPAVLISMSEFFIASISMHMESLVRNM